MLVILRIWRGEVNMGFLKWAFQKGKRVAAALLSFITDVHSSNNSSCKDNVKSLWLHRQVLNYVNPHKE